MKKILLALLLCFITSYAVQAQTKDETIKWLQEKLQKYSTSHYIKNIEVKVDECFIIFSYVLLPETNRDRIKYENQYHIFPSDGMIFTESILGGSEEKIISIGIKGGLSRIRTKHYGKESLENNSQFHLIMGEENLSDRLNKAVTHLATFCPKTKETF